MSTQTLPQARPSKNMSSRLMTMKFMQRAVVSPSAVPQSHTHSSDARPSKRQKVFGVPSSTATSFSDLQLIQVALAEEEEKKGKSVERLADEIEETDWVLSTVNGDGEHGVKGILVTKAGYSDIDQEAWRPAIVGRRSFRKFNRELESTDILHVQKHQDGVANKSSSSGEIDSEDSEEHDVKLHDPASIREVYPTSKEEVIRRVSDERHQRQQQRRAEKAELAHLADKRRSKKLKLNNLSSISGGGGNKLDMECYFCGGKGHAKRECPQKRKRRNEDGHSETVKRTKSSLDS